MKPVDNLTHKSAFLGSDAVPSDTGPYSNKPQCCHDVLHMLRNSQFAHMLHVKQKVESKA